MQFIGANSTPEIIGEEKLAGKSNYFVGNDAKKWSTNIAHYARARYKTVYPGIDLVYYGNQHSLEYDFVVAPGADPKAIRLAFHGMTRMSVDKKGNLILDTNGGKIIQHAPKVYQSVNGKRKDIAAHYLLRTKNQISLTIGAYDPKKTLIIDPVISYSTYLGGSGFDVGADIAIDRWGNAYVTGTTRSTDFPVTQNALQPDSAGAMDVFVAKLNVKGDALVYATYLGGNSFDQSPAIAVDRHGNAYVTGGTLSSDFPTTGNAF